MILSEAPRRKACMCGNNATLQLKAKLGREFDQIVTVFNVPVYCCSNCDIGFLTGSDSIQFAKLVHLAVKQNREEIYFDE